MARLNASTEHQIIFSVVRNLPLEKWRLLKMDITTRRCVLCTFGLCLKYRVNEHSLAIKETSFSDRGHTSISMSRTLHAFSFRACG